MTIGQRSCPNWVYIEGPLAEEPHSGTASPSTTTQQLGEYEHVILLSHLTEYSPFSLEPKLFLLLPLSFLWTYFFIYHVGLLGLMSYFES